MSTFATSHEILKIRGTQPTLIIHPNAGNAADQGVRISDEHILPARVTELIASAQATLGNYLRIEDQEFLRFVQASPSSGQFHYGEAVLSLSADATPTTVAQCRDAAVQFCHLIGSANSEAAQATLGAPTTSPEAGSEREPLRHEDLRQATFLGMRIPVPLELLVPGQASLRIQKRFQRSPSRGTSDVVHEVLAEFCSVKVGAKQTTLGVSGRSLLDGQSFARKPILVARSDVPRIGAALCDLKTQLRLWINVHILDEGRAKPRRTNTLIKLEFDVTENDEPPAAAIPPARTEDEPLQVQVAHQVDSTDCATAETPLCIALAGPHHRSSVSLQRSGPNDEVRLDALSPPNWQSDESHSSAPQEALCSGIETVMADASVEATPNTAAAFQRPDPIGNPPSLYLGAA